MQRPPHFLIVLLTDFGLIDAYVGTMKGVIAGIAPSANVIDLSHEVSPQDVAGAAFILEASYRYFPAGTIFCCVVDPGVGGGRLGVALRVEAADVGPFFLVGPDNGLFGPVLEHTPATVTAVLDEPSYHLSGASATFHGRDIFAPAAAHLATGVDLRRLGSRLEPASLTRLDRPEPKATGAGWRASVIHIDHFGNLITNFPGDRLEPPLESWCVAAGETEVNGVKRTFTDVAVGEAVAYIGSSGYLELAVRQGDAAKAFGLIKGAEVVLTRRKARSKE